MVHMFSGSVMTVSINTITWCQTTTLTI